MVAPIQKSKGKGPSVAKPATTSAVSNPPSTTTLQAPSTGGLGKDASAAKAIETDSSAAAIDIESIEFDLGSPQGGSAPKATAQTGKGKGRGDAAQDGQNSFALSYDTEDGAKTSVTLHATDKVTIQAHVADKDGKTKADATVRYQDDQLDAKLGYDTEKGVNGGVAYKATKELTLTVNASQTETTTGKGEKSQGAKSQKPQEAKGGDKATGSKGSDKATGSKGQGG